MARLVGRARGGVVELFGRTVPLIDMAHSDAKNMRERTSTGVREVRGILSTRSVGTGRMNVGPPIDINILNRWGTLYKRGYDYAELYGRGGALGHAKWFETARDNLKR